MRVCQCDEESTPDPLENVAGKHARLGQRLGVADGKVVDEDVQQRPHGEDVLAEREMNDRIPRKAGMKQATNTRGGFERDRERDIQDPPETGGEQA